MNKSEREKLASIVSEMRYSYDSTPETISWGNLLYSEFPCISALVEQYRGVQIIDNITKGYISYILKMSCSYSCMKEEDKRIQELGFSSSESLESLYNVFDDFFCRETDFDMQEVNNLLGGEPNAANDMVNQLLSNGDFIEAIDCSEELSNEQKSLFKGYMIKEKW